MRPVGGRLAVVDERGNPRPAAGNMGMDQALLEECGTTGPVLRLYSWAEPSVSFGYFLAWREAAAAAVHGEPVVRRWTGGGIVHHGADFTWSLIVPRAHPFAAVRPVESFVRLHAVLARALTGAGVPGVEAVPAGGSAPRGGMCFERPAPGDLLCGGRKIAGAGQRRTRAGLLHQGSVRVDGRFDPDALAERLPALLAEEVVRVEPWRSVTGRAAELAAERYATDAWNRRI